MNFKLHFLGLLGAATLALLGGAPAGAVEVESARDDTYAQLAQGELKSMALTSDGYLVPSYAREQVGDTRNELVWDALREKGGTVLAATGHHGKLVRLADGKSSKTLASLPEPELTALAPLRDGSVLVAAAPTGRIYRLGADDKLSTFTQLKAKFVWRLVPDDDGSVWAVTGTEGRLFHLRDEGGKAKVEEVAKFKSANLLDMWIDRNGLLGQRGDIYVGGQNPGWLYRYRPSTRHAEVAFNAQAEEIRRLLPLKEGLALALNTERSPSSQALNLTLRMGGGSSMPLGGGPGSPMGGPGSSSSSGDSGFGQTFAPTPQGSFGPPRSEVVLLDRSGFTRTLWSAPDRPIHDLALSPQKNILVSAGNQGRLFELSLTGDYTVVADVRDDFIMRINADEKGYLLAAARNGVVFHMSTERAGEAVYVSRPIDAGKLVKWGHLYWHGDLNDGQQAQFSFRVGNDGDGDSEFWGPWSASVDAKPLQELKLPAGPARYLQYRLTFRQGQGDGAPARLDHVDLFFMGRNAAPKVIAVQVSEAAPLASRSGSSSPSSSASSPSEGSSGGSSGGGSSPSREREPAGQSVGGVRQPRSNPMSLNISWRVSDPNGDSLRYTVYFKADDETVWKLIDKDLTQTQMPLSVAGLADGHFRFRVVASDAQANPPGEGLRDEGISNEIVVDNTPPAIESKAVRLDGRRAVLTFNAADAVSLMSSVRVDLDNGDDFPLLPVDGVMDQPRESFRWQTKALSPGEHVATITATDARGNTSVDKVIFNVPR